MLRTTGEKSRYLSYPQLEQLVAAGSWDKTAPGPTLPEEVISNTLARYQEAHDRLAGAPVQGVH